MNRLIGICLLVLVCSFFMTSSVMAYPFIEVEGWVNPFAGTVNKGTDATTLSKVEYLFKVTSNGGSGALMDSLSLEFEYDVFKNADTASVTLSHGWSLYDPLDPMDSGAGSYRLAHVGSSGNPVNVGDTLTLSIFDLIVYNDALDPVSGASFWNEGLIWAHSFYAGDTAPDTFFPTGDGGSTAPIPELGTFILLGSGVVGVVLYARKKKCLISI